MDFAQQPCGELVPGGVIAGKYTLVRPVGTGGMGAVWVARNEATGADVALKLLLSAEDDSETMARFRREAQATARLSHRGIVRIYDLIELPPEGKRVAIVMELLHGRTLAAHLADRGRLSMDEAAGIVLPLLSALAHAHGLGIIHRDLKPENVFLSVEPDGLVTPKILDFGISKLRFPKAEVITREGEMLGTPSYMSPEQVRGRPCVDARSDLFNVGILLYELLTGKNPFAKEGVHSVVVAVLEDEAPRIEEVPVALWNVIERALRKSPDERYACAADLAIALRSAIGMPSRVSYPPELSATLRLACSPITMAPVREIAKKRGWPFVASAAAAAGLAAVAAAILALWTMEVPPSPHDPSLAPVGVVPMTDTPPLAVNAKDTVEPVPKSPRRPEGHSSESLPTVPKRSPPPPARRSLLVRDPGF